ncbi:MAG: hypothetical protein IJ194_06255 [Bacilli bacterium]|jgi:hypothetical protein|nr:hypothetical protein [Bacilli bacterium]
MKILIYPIYSPLHNGDFMKRETERLLKSLKEKTSYDFLLTDIDHLYDGDMALILVESGGSEHYYLEVKDRLKEPVYLLTFGNNNSLAASLEILTYIQNHKQKGEILHGSDEYIANRILTLLKKGEQHD